MKTAHLAALLGCMGSLAVVGCDAEGPLAPAEDQREALALETGKADGDLLVTKEATEAVEVASKGASSAPVVLLTGLPEAGWANAVTVGVELIDEGGSVEGAVALYVDGEPVEPGTTITAPGSHQVSAVAWNELGEDRASAHFFIPSVPQIELPTSVSSMSCKAGAEGVWLATTLRIDPTAAGAPLVESSLRLYPLEPSWDLGAVGHLFLTPTGAEADGCVAEVSFEGFLPGLPGCPTDVFFSGQADAEQPTDVRGLADATDEGASAEGKEGGTTTLPKDEAGAGDGGCGGDGEPGPKPLVAEPTKKEPPCRWRTILLDYTSTDIDDEDKNKVYSCGDFWTSGGEYWSYDLQANGLFMEGENHARVKNCWFASTKTQVATGYIAWKFEPSNPWTCKCDALCNAHLEFTLDGELDPDAAVAADGTLAVNGCFDEGETVATGGFQLGAKEPLITEWVLEYGYKDGKLFLKNLEKAKRVIHPEGKSFHDTFQAKPPPTGSEHSEFTIQARSEVRMHAQAESDFHEWWWLRDELGESKSELSGVSPTYIKVRGRCQGEAAYTDLLHYDP